MVEEINSIKFVSQLEQQKIIKEPLYGTLHRNTIRPSFLFVLETKHLGLFCYSSSCCPNRFFQVELVRRYVTTSPLTPIHIGNPFHS
jgi:hypothetical protein